jgi:hypothetical protein
MNNKDKVARVCFAPGLSILHVFFQYIKEGAWFLIVSVRGSGMLNFA